jgi:hypothetical protein
MRSDLMSRRNSTGFVTRAGRQTFEAYLAKMRFVTGQPSNNSR